MVLKIWSQFGKAKGQVTVEYFLIFAAIAAAVIIGFSAFHGSIRNALEGFANAAADKITR
ncbi:MAG: hypothetical protein HYY90_04990 [Candidatus Omnitrophica bacterium]|nr:hypothetical protein [Candidatus Omnitrophota bacterium]MBI3020785.1 hypothetical protein [Candidatus Omnitrophota bacterium]MBI3083699.1 hypothetical protein [Candidatus Omnitrophota bacterium]